MRIKFAVGALVLAALTLLGQGRALAVNPACQIETSQFLEYDGGSTYFCSEIRACTVKVTVCALMTEQQD
jgi:hypothetical protein